MATAQNTTVKIYEGVPLVKGGTEVLFLSQSAAQSALAQFLKKTYTQYYYTRENRGYIQVEDTIDNVEGANYVVFQNNSHGGKLFFGFIDRLVYINDNVTQIEFTIDPFPTYLGDTHTNSLVHVVRNSPRSDIAANNKNYVPDYLPRTVNYRFTTIQRRTFDCHNGVCYFVAPSILASTMTDQNNSVLGIQVGRPDATALDNILRNNGSLIGGYLVPDELYGGGGPTLPFQFPIIKNIGTIEGNPFTQAGMGDINGARFGKIKTGVYNKIVLRTSQGSKEYDLEAFSMPLSGNITFGVVGLMMPSPSIFIYPKNYCGVQENLAEGIMMSCPALPITANSTYTSLQGLNDSWATLVSTAGGIVGGAIKGGSIGGVPMAIAGGLLGAATGLLSEGKNYVNTILRAPSLISNGNPTCSVNGVLEANLQVVSPDVEDVASILNYFDYYGYNVEKEQTYINDEDGAYIQTGSEYLFGSEADLELNLRMMNGIKIRKSFT